MDTAIQVVGVVVYGLLMLAALSFARQQRSRAATWAALTFADLELIVVLGAIAPDVQPTGGRLTGEALYQDLTVLLLTVFPYLLHRFVRALRPRTGALERIIDVGLAGMVAWTLLAPPLPAADVERPAWVLAFTGVFLLWWTVVFASVAWQLWRMGRDQPGIVRNRMRLMGSAAILMNLALMASVFAGPDADAITRLLTAALGWTSGLLFLVGIMPPPSLRLLWRNIDEGALRVAESGLLGARSRTEAAEAVVGAAAWLVGGSSSTITDVTGETLAHVGTVHESGDPLVVRGTNSVVRVVPGRLSPVLGQGEQDLLAQLCTHLDLALTRIEALAESERLRAEAERSTEDLQQLVYGVSHDLRNPLVTITGFLKLLERQEGLTDHSTMLIERINASAAYMERLVNDLLQLSRVGHADAERTDVPLGEVLEMVIADLAIRYPDLVVDVGPLPTVHMNSVRARQLFANLIENAARYAHPDGGPVHVTVSSTQSGGTAVIDVADDGEGIPEDQRERVFQIFQRLRGFDTRSSGTGIGLTMCRRIVVEVGGTIAVADSPGGTTMRITMPTARTHDDGQENP